MKPARAKPAPAPPREMPLDYYLGFKKIYRD